MDKCCFFLPFTVSNRFFERIETIEMIIRPEETVEFMDSTDSEQIANQIVTTKGHLSFA